MKDNTHVRVWDLPLRIFHWCLVALIAVSMYTGFSGGFREMDYHMMSGYAVLTLVIFRIAWGIAGSGHSRFTTFIKPRAVWPYLKGLLNKDQPPSLGHNPLGAISTIVLLLLLGIQAVTGLFANDDIMLEGPLVHLVENETSNYLSGVHDINKTILLCFIGLHLVGIAFHEIYKKERLILAMLTGKKKTDTRRDSPAGEAPRPILEVAVATALFSTTAALVYWLVNYL
jgi:cytochrome b